MRMLRDASALRRPVSRRGLRGQRRKRSCERRTRRAAVAYVRFARGHGRELRQAAGHLGLSPRTVSRWWREWKTDQLALRARGRPTKTIGPWRRASVIGAMRKLPGVGVPTLRVLFPDVGKRELQELVDRFRSATRRDRRLLIHALRWTRPGSVWAIDFSEPPCPINGVHDQILCVRDLGSGCELWTLPILGKCAEVAIHSLKALVHWYGAPLVLKLDNDGVFRSHAVKRWAREVGIRLLYSPPYTPEYNGSIETGMGSLKTLAHVASALHDRPGQWTCDDIEEARCRMNLEGRPRGARGPSPDELWRGRDRINDAERDDFNTTYHDHYIAECDARELDPAVQWQHTERASIDRAALTSTLVKHGLLCIRRRRITLPIRKRNRAIIS
jgi:transposase InsO family protein